MWGWSAILAVVTRRVECVLACVADTTRRETREPKRARELLCFRFHQRLLYVRM